MNAPLPPLPTPTLEGTPLFDFFVPGNPVPKKRPRVVRAAGGKVRTFTPEATLQYEKSVAWRAAAARVRPLDESRKVGVVLFLRCLRGSQGQMPDCDNVAKAILDGLNGQAWGDDRQVRRLLVDMEEAESEADAGARVRVYDLGPLPPPVRGVRPSKSRQLTIRLKPAVRRPA